jgi:hypothetical protein
MILTKLYKILFIVLDHNALYVFEGELVILTNLIPRLFCCAFFI